jgi:hypothetical protein
VGAETAGGAIDALSQDLHPPIFSRCLEAGPSITEETQYDVFLSHNSDDKPLGEESALRYRTKRERTRGSMSGQSAVVAGGIVK